MPEVYSSWVAALGCKLELCDIRVLASVSLAFYGSWGRTGTLRLEPWKDVAVYPGPKACCQCWLTPGQISLSSVNGQGLVP